MSDRNLVPRTYLQACLPASITAGQVEALVERPGNKKRKLCYTGEINRLTLFYIMHLSMFSPRVGYGGLPTKNWLSQLSPGSRIWHLDFLIMCIICIDVNTIQVYTCPFFPGNGNLTFTRSPGDGDVNSGFHENVKCSRVCPPPTLWGLILTGA